MTADLIIKGARITDGTGLPAFTGDVEVRGGRITRVGRLTGTAADKVIDADGLDLTPGFVDVHTHYDAQLHFESSASPSSPRPRAASPPESPRAQWPARRLRRRSNAARNWQCQNQGRCPTCGVRPS